MARLAVSEKVNAFKNVVRTDNSTNRVKNFIVEGAPKLPGATKNYLLDKVPIAQWLPRYHPSWLLQDFIAGLTIGVMLIPQGLAYAKIATIPIENGLYSSWVPAAVAVFMGTSKDLSSGPTSILGLLTAEIVESYSDEYSPAAIASAVAFMVGIYSLILGLLGLGFLLDYVSVPVLTGFISATALTIGFGQLGSLIGLDNTPSMIFDIIGDALKRLPKWNGPTCGIGIGSILLLIALEKLGKRYGNKHFVLKYISSSRAIIVLFIFTLISYLVNKDRGSKTLWAISKVSTHGIATPHAHDSGLLAKAAARAFAPLIACTLEHLAVGKAFGRRNGYTIDQTQELNYLGVTNLINSFFGAMPVGGAMSRTAINSECRVRSPLNGLVTAAWIILTLYIMAVINLFGPVSLFYRYWRISMADFVASQLSFWITIFVSAEIGIGAAVGWSIVWSLLRSAFVKPDVQVSAEDNAPAESQDLGHLNTTPGDLSSITVPSDTVVVHFNDSIFFPNAARGKRVTVEAIQLVYDKLPDGRMFHSRERSWSVAAERRVERIRKERGISLRDSILAVVIFDFTMVSWIDTTGVLALGELKADIRLHCGKEVQFRFVGMNKSVRKRFARALWKLTEFDDEHHEGVDIVYPTLERAIVDRERLGSVLEAVIAEKTVD
ncbi:putative Sulfate permease [Seiridium unicorne]|uniref:Sulfate permease n=1 Tax=Seiridium unicorne TaxID=138068 RepID=A0ABR2UEJ8_9PEZI